MVADKLKLRVQPVVLVGTSKTFDSGPRIFYPFNQEIHVIFLDAFDADRDDKQWLHNLQVKMQETYDEHNDLISRR